MTKHDELAEQLERTDLFSGLSKRAIHRLEGDGEVMQFAAGAVVTVEGARTSGLAAFAPGGVNFHLVLEGSGEVHKDGVLVATIGPGSYFGELAIIDGLPRSADVIAGPDGLTTFALDKWRFQSLLEEHPEVAVPMLKVLAARLRAAEPTH